MIKEAYCSKEVSIILKEKGFNWECRTCYEHGELKTEVCRQYVDWNSRNEVWELMSAPTHQMAMAWLREVHKILIVIDAYHADHWEGYIDSFEISIYSHASTIIVPNEIVHHTDYTEAVETALKYVLENLI